jgi:glycosyltransferase involved in cell wall biosynthesis
MKDGSMPRLLWHSNAPWSPTGYGQQTALFAPHIAQHYDLAISSFYGLEGSPLTWDGIPVFPGLGDGQYGNSQLIPHATHFFGGDPKGGLVVTLMDVWVMDAQMASQLNMACWVPVDHEPAPPPVVQFFVESGAVPIAMSRFGQQMLGRLDPLYVPHGVDTEIYKPYSRKAMREEVGVPRDAFLVGMVAANKGRPSRKGFSQAFQAFARFAEKHDNAYLYLHTMVQPGLGQGEDIPALLNALGIPSDRVLTTDQYRAVFNPHPPETMAKIYSALDVLLNPSMGEGFGITVLEAQACGVPAIVTDFSAMSEVCGSGWQVDHTKMWTGQNSWQVVPNVDDITDALEECYARPSMRRQKMSDAARNHAMGYDVHRVAKTQMLPALKIAEDRFAKQQPVRIAPRLKVAA